MPETAEINVKVFESESKVFGQCYFLNTQNLKSISVSKIIPPTIAQVTPGEGYAVMAENYRTKISSNTWRKLEDAINSGNGPSIKNIIESFELKNGSDDIYKIDMNKDRHVEKTPYKII